MNKSYYAIIPANVRYDKNLPANAKLLYGEITALTNEKGFCWATNGYFADLYGASNRTIQRWIKSLEDSGYIYINTTMSDHGSIRKIALNVGGDKNVAGGVTKMSHPHDKNVTHNNTVNNNTHIDAREIILTSLSSAPRKEKEVWGMKYQIGAIDLATLYEEFAVWYIAKTAEKEGYNNAITTISQMGEKGIRFMFENSFLRNYNKKKQTA